jgi:uncharacterized protein (DUF2062 family)
MGIAPLWGFQMLIAIGISIYFKLNKALVLIAANISFPPFIPLILYLSHLAGKIWMGDHAVELSFDENLNPEMIYNTFTLYSFIQYILGAVTLALGSGVFFGLVTYILLKFSKHERLQREP